MDFLDYWDTRIEQCEKDGRIKYPQLMNTLYDEAYLAWYAGRIELEKEQLKMEERRKRTYKNVIILKYDDYDIKEDINKKIASYDKILHALYVFVELPNGGMYSIKDRYDVRGKTYFAE